MRFDLCKKRVSTDLFRELCSFVLNTDTKQYETFVLSDLVWIFYKSFKICKLCDLESFIIEVVEWIK